MTNRFHIPVVITAADSTDRTEITADLEALLLHMEEMDDVYRAYVEESVMDESQGEKLLEMLGEIEEDDLISALETIDTLQESDTES